jgi:rhamnose transport system permease protein
VTAQTETSTPAPAQDGAPESGRQFVDTLIRARELSLVGVLVLLVAGTTLANPRFLNSQNIRDILLDVSIVALLAVGQTVVVVTRNIDLSVGSVLGITAFLTGVLFADHHVAIPIAFVAGILVGGVFGLINGAMVAYARVPSLVITLGTLYVFRGFDFLWVKGRQINASDMPDGFLKLASDSVLGIPLLAIIAAVVMVCVGMVMRSSRSGRELYAIGSNPDAATLAGIRVTRRLVAAFTASGALAGLAGVLYAARYGTLDANVGTGQELAVVAAVVVGGVAIFGGAGSVYGAALGALLLSCIGSALVILKVNQFWEQAIDGFLLLVAIGLDRLLALRVAAVLRKRSGRHAG